MNNLLTLLKKQIAVFVLTAFCCSSTVPLAYSQAAADLPLPGAMVHSSDSFTPSRIVGVKVFSNDPFRFDFIIDRSNAASGREKDIEQEEARRLIKYFLASLAVPEKDIWVNLSPYEGDRIIDDEFGLTEMGRDILAQDYVLKQLAATMVYPEEKVGKEFWSKVYAKAYERYGTTDIPAETFHKVWIVPDGARVYEDAETNTAVIVESHLKVMAEEDYLARDSRKTDGSAGKEEEAGRISASVLREIVLPEIEREVNEGRNFAQLRQVYHSLVLAVWYKQRLKDSVLGRGFSDKKKTAGIDITDHRAKEKIYAQYLEAYRRGVYNYIKEDVDKYSGEVIPRKYFSGGFDAAMIVQTVHYDGTRDQAQDTVTRKSVVVASARLDPIRWKSFFFRSLRGTATTLALTLALSGLSGCALNKLHNRDFITYVKPSVRAQSDFSPGQGGAVISSAASLPDILRPFLEALDRNIKMENEVLSAATARGEDTEDIVSNTEVLKKVKTFIEAGKRLSEGDIYKEMFNLRRSLNDENRLRDVLTAFDRLTGLYHMGQFNPAKPTVIYVVGAGADPYSGFSNFYKDPWIAENYNTVIAYYNYLADPEDQSKTLAREVSRLKAKTDKQISFVTHSMGYMITVNMFEKGLVPLADVGKVVMLSPIIGGVSYGKYAPLLPVKRLVLGNGPYEFMVLKVSSGELQKRLLRWMDNLSSDEMAKIVPLVPEKKDPTLSPRAYEFAKKHGFVVPTEGDNPHSDINFAPKSLDVVRESLKNGLRGSGVVEGGRADQAMATPYGGIDLEKTSVSVDKKGGGVSAFSDPGQALELLDQSAGLEIGTLDIRSLTPQLFPNFFGRRGASGSSPRM